MEDGRELDVWLDDALASYADVAVPPGYEARMLGTLRERMSLRARWLVLAWMSPAIATALIFAMVSISQAVLDAPPLLHAVIEVPIVSKVSVEPSVSRSSLRGKTPTRSTRGIPIVAAQWSPQEHAILNMVRKSHERELASLAVQQQEEAKALEESRAEFEKQRREQ